jgi:hypothetical protein
MSLTNPTGTFSGKQLVKISNLDVISTGSVSPPRDGII